MENKSLFQYWLRLGDSSLILGHRLSEWCGHGPILEEDIAMTNIALDLIGQARIALSNAASLEGKGRTEDDLAFHRDVSEFRNLLLCEQPNGDFGKTMMRQFLFSVFTYHLYTELKKSKNADLAAFAEKSLKEVTYHVRHTADWIVRLGDGTEESHQRVQDAADELWMYTGDLFATDDIEKELQAQGLIPDMESVRKSWKTMVSEIFQKATLKMPEDGFMLTGSRGGYHTESLGYLLAEMQFLPRAYPGSNW